MGTQAPTPTEQELDDMIQIIRVLVGDTESSMFYPLMSDEDIISMLKVERYNVLKAAKRSATTIAFLLATSNTRERIVDIDVFNEASTAYKEVLELFIKDVGNMNLPNALLPYAAGISKEDYCKSIRNPDTKRSPLAQITPCNAWWTDRSRYNPCTFESVF